MASDPFTIRIFVPDGDPDGVKVIDKMNWTGTCVVFPREKWLETKPRKEFEQSGVYILIGYDRDDDLPTLYIGQTDNLSNRIDQHYRTRGFWERGIVFVSTSHGLNRAHVMWLENELILKARAAGQCHIDNDRDPREPTLSEFEKADTAAFLKEILQVLPLVGVHAFEKRPVTDPDSYEAREEKRVGLNTDNDTIIVPAQRDGFERVFLGENAWSAIRISGGMRPLIKWIAAYQSQPISAITHVAEVDHIEPYGDSGKYKVIFKGPAQELDQPIPFGDATTGAMQGPRYTTIEKLRAAKTVSDLVG